MSALQSHHSDHCFQRIYREHGPLSLVNRRRGQPGNRQLMPGLAERALLIIRERYADFGPTLACEKLAELHGLYLAKETVRKLMIQAEFTGCGSNTDAFSKLQGFTAKFRRMLFTGFFTG